MKAIVLCGGLGTRLGALTHGYPKPILPIAGRPFLAYLLDQISLAPFDEIILAVGFCWEKIQNEVGHQWSGIKVSYSVEERSLGTGGAIKKAMEGANIKEAVIFNGDSFFKINAFDLKEFAYLRNADIAIALKEVPDAYRFGRVSVDTFGRVINFEEKGKKGSGLINAGVYYVKSSVFRFTDNVAFSFENDVLEKYYADLNIYGIKRGGYFIDMGIHEDLARAQYELPASVDK